MRSRWDNVPKIPLPTPWMYLKLTLGASLARRLGRARLMNPLFWVHE